MKLFCSLRNRIATAPPGTNHLVVLYSQADTPNTVSVGATALQKLINQKFMPAPRAWDLLTIALSVIAADASVSRGNSPDGWTRQIELCIAVIDPDFWSSQAGLLASQLCFLTTDMWSLEFTDGGILPTPSNKRVARPHQNCVCLLSGGLDSLIGACNLAADTSRNPYLVSQVSHGDKNRQTQFAHMIAGGLPLLQLNHSVKVPWKNERSQRARSIIFLAYGVLMATSLNRYHEGKQVMLYVCENGFISINPPLTTGRVGSLSTRTTHPVFIRQFQQLIGTAGLNIQIVNPYQFKTKGEMLRESTDQVFLKTHASNTTSCGRFGYFSYCHCGRCVPCLIRRAAFHSWGISDTTAYVYDDLSIDDSNHAGFDDVRSAAVAVAELQAEGIDRWIWPRLMVQSLGETTSYKEVVHRGLDELGVFLTAAGVK